MTQQTDRPPQLQIYPIRRTNQEGNRMRTRYGWRLLAPNYENLAGGNGGKLRSFATRQLAWENFLLTMRYGTGLHSTMLPSTIPVSGPKGTVLLSNMTTGAKLRVSVDCEVRL